MHEVKLGQLIKHGVPERDAIHVAVIPAMADHLMQPGCHITLEESTQYGGYCLLAKRSESPEQTVAIVDPYLTGFVYPGETFWALMLPNTITGMRHHWRHPAVDNLKPELKEAKQWIEAFAAKIGYTYEGLMEIAETYQATGVYHMDNSERYKDVDWDQWREFWRYYDVITGSTAEDTDDAPFTCSC